MGKIKQIRNTCEGSVYRTGSTSEKGFASDALPRTAYGSDLFSNMTMYSHRTGHCDSLVLSYSGSIKSPDYPLSYGPNTACAYTIKRPAPDVCRVELVLRKFDVRGSGKECTDFLELPDRRKVCGIRSETLTMEYSRHSDYMVLMFRSDYASTAAGFDIDVRQIPASCVAVSRGESDGKNHGFNSNGTFSVQARKCDQTISSYSSRIVSPNFPWTYEPETFCMYMIEPADTRMCYFSLDFAKFELDGISEFTDNLCTKDYFQLPDGHRLCSNYTGKS